MSDSGRLGMACHLVLGGDEPTLKASRTAVPEMGSEEPTVMRGPDPALLAAAYSVLAAD